jgi:hypothetical protein
MVSGGHLDAIVLFEKFAPKHEFGPKPVLNEIFVFNFFHHLEVFSRSLNYDKEEFDGPGPTSSRNRRNLTQNVNFDLNRF